MYSGTIDIGAGDGGIDLQKTLECGQTFLWRRSDGEMFSDTAPSDAWYYTAFPLSTEPVFHRVRRNGPRLEWESTAEDGEAAIRQTLGLGDDLGEIRRTLRGRSPDDLLHEALDAVGGLRVVSDPAFPCLVSFICSPQMRVGRIHEMQVELAERFGGRVTAAGEQYAVSPTPDELAAASEDALREAGLGYRAPYVKRTAEMVAGGEATPEGIVGRPYEEAREAMTAFVGVGDKVADCVLLYALGYREAVPIDTWVMGAIEDNYPECDRGSYAETSRAIREKWGEYAGYAQAYVFDYLRRS